MGCDIHIVLERRELGEKEWIGLFSTDAIRPRPRIARRDYGLFAELAAVRGSPSDFRFYPRNLPKDVSALAWAEYMRAPTDHHHPSHLSIPEFVEAYTKANPEQINKPDGFRPEFAAADLFGIMDEEGHEYRVVFWFDN